MLFFIWNEQIISIRDGSTHHYDIFNELDFYAKLKPNFQNWAGLNKKKSERFSLNNLFCVALMDIGVPQSIWHYFQPSNLCFDCMFCLFFKLNLGSVLNTVYRIHSPSSFPLPIYQREGWLYCSWRDSSILSLTLRWDGAVVLRWLHTGD